MRLDKFVANYTAWSRSEVKKLIKKQAVLVNGVPAQGPEQKILEFEDTVYVDDKRVEALEDQYLMLHKPMGVVCANSHSDHPTVIDLLEDLKPEQKRRLQIAGRLDVDTTGLVLLTNDGQWNHIVTSPRSDCMKIYDVELHKNFEEEYINEFKSGMLLDGEDKPTLPAQIEIIDPQRIRLGICEGRYHQVKRMFLKANNEVKHLHRASIGPLKLDPNLKPGQFRKLSKKEVSSLANKTSSAHVD